LKKLIYAASLYACSSRATGLRVILEEGRQVLAEMGMRLTIRAPPQDPPTLESENHHEKGERGHTITFGFDMVDSRYARRSSGGIRLLVPTLKNLSTPR
jgi:hypothetical protein